MRYLNRKGESISSLEWHRLYADPKYSIVETTRVSKRIIETTWVGVVPFSEQTAPKLYVVQLLRSLSTLEEERKEDGELACYWCSTEAEAAKTHRWLVEKEQARVYGRPIK